MIAISHIERAGIGSDGRDKVSADALRIGKGYAAVFDGATPGSEQKTYVALPGMTDAQWIANEAARIFPEVIQGRALDSIVPAMIHRLSDIFYTKAKKHKDGSPVYPEWLKPCECPSTTMSCAIQRGDKIHFLQVGDSPILIKLKSGEIDLMKGDPVLTDHDRRIHDYLQLLRKISPRRSMKELNDLRRGKIPCIRDSMNKAGGYSVLTIQPPQFLCVKPRSFHVSEIEGFVLMTDGLLEAWEFGFFQNKSEFYDALTQPEGLSEVVDWLRKLQLEDLEGESFPRIKVGDDIAAIYGQPTVNALR